MNLLQALQVIQLGSDIAAGIVKPVPVVVGAMHSEWTAQSIAEFTRSESVLTRKDFYSVPQTGCVLDLHALPEGDVVDVDPALFCQERLFAEDPECPPRRDISKAG